MSCFVGKDIDICIGSIKVCKNERCLIFFHKVTVATLLFSLNFGLFFLALRRRFREIWRSEELRFFLAVVALATVLIAWDLTPVYHQGVLESLRYAFFHVTSVISTSGFFTEDYALWPQFSQMVLVLLMSCLLAAR